MRNELYHSDKYLGQDFSNGIKHYKYIKREMKNGKWVYYYKDDLTNKAQKNLNKALNKYGDARNAESRPYYKKKNAKSGLDYSKKVIAKNNENKSKIATKYMDAKWYQLSKKKQLKDKAKEIDAETSRYKGYIKEDKAAIKEADKDMKKLKAKTKQALTDYNLAADKLKRAKQKDKGKKAVAKVLVKGLNTAESVKSTVKNTSNKIEKTAKKASKEVKKITKDVKTDVDNWSKQVKEDVKRNINKMKDNHEYKKAVREGYSSYKDSSGRTRLTELETVNRAELTVDNFKKYRELKAEEDRINAKKKKKKK